MNKILRNTITINLSCLKKNEPQILYDIIYTQFCSMLHSFWENFNVESVPLKCIFITYIHYQADILQVKELYETDELGVGVIENKEWINGISPLVIGFIILHERKDYNCFKYNLKINYIDRIQSLFMGYGIGSKMIKRVENIKKKQLIPLVIITHSVKFWFKYLYKKFKFTTSSRLKQKIKDLSLSYELSWKYIFNELDMKCEIIINQVATNFVKQLLKF